MQVQSADSLCKKVWSQNRSNVLLGLIAIQTTDGFLNNSFIKLILMKKKNQIIEVMLSNLINMSTQSSIKLFAAY